MKSRPSLSNSRGNSSYWGIINTIMKIWQKNNMSKTTNSFYKKKTHLLLNSPEPKTNLPSHSKRLRRCTSLRKLCPLHWPDQRYSLNRTTCWKTELLFYSLRKLSTVQDLIKIQTWKFSRRRSTTWWPIPTLQTLSRTVTTTLTLSRWNRTSATCRPNYSQS